LTPWSKLRPQPSARPCSGCPQAGAQPGQRPAIGGTVGRPHLGRALGGWSEGQLGGGQGGPGLAGAELIDCTGQDRPFPAIRLAMIGRDGLEGGVDQAFDLAPSIVGARALNSRSVGNCDRKISRFIPSPAGRPPRPRPARRPFG
jgi:hypothetical protein